MDTPGTRRFRIADMDCAAEESEIRRAVAGVDGVRALTFQLGRRTLAIDAAAGALEQALAAIRKAGFDPQPMADAAQGVSAPGHAHSDGHAHAHDPAHLHDHAHEHGHAKGHGHSHDHSRAHAHAHEHGAETEGKARLAAALLLAIGAEAIGYFVPATLPWRAIGLAVAAVAIALAGWSVYAKGLRALRHGRLNINALMTVAVSGAFAIGQWPEAAMVMALYAIAEAIEARAVDRARHAIQRLLELAPDEAAVRQSDGSWATRPVAAVALDAVVRVRPGERVPLDGTVVAGHSAIDQAPVTGESLPVDKTVGDAVFAGTINQSGTLELRVTAPASNSTLARIIHAVEQAQATRAPTQGFVDRFAAVYTPAVFAIALAVALLGPWLLGWAWHDAIYKALVLLVIACPCALVISTPVTIVSALAAAARRGILIKGGIHLEGARRLKAIAFDKTGTVTAGAPTLVHHEAIGNAPAATVRALAAALAGHSDHPVSRAIAQGLGASSLPVNGLEALPGRGVQAEIAGTTYALGNHRLIEERNQCSSALEARLLAHEQVGRTVALLASGAGVLALFAVADPIKPSSKAAVAELKALGIAPVMLSGDNQATVQAIAREAGIDEARGNLLPHDKLDAIRALQAAHGATAMAGDGINDAPALAQADIGIAMGAAGTDIALEAADVVVMNDDLHRIAETVRLSRRTHGVLWQNIALALGIKAVFLVLAVLGQATMWMAVFADMGASLLVVGNGLRLLAAGENPQPREPATR